MAKNKQINLREFNTPAAKKTLMKNLSLLFISFALLFSSGCKSQQINNSANYWDGRDMNVINETFSGRLPCADCEKIDYSLTLKPDMTWHSRMVYVGRDAKAFEERGHYNVTEEGILVLHKAGEGMDRFREVPQGLLMLDTEGKEIKDAPKGMFLLTPAPKGKAKMLKSRSDTIPDKRLNNTWVMIQLGDSLLNPDNFMNGLPVIGLSVTTRDVSGHDGCNRIRGSFSTEGNTIKFGELITTKMACPHKSWSNRIVPAFSGKSFRYSFGNKHLILKQDHKVISVFKNIE